MPALVATAGRTSSFVITEMSLTASPSPGSDIATTSAPSPAKAMGIAP